MRFQFRLLAQGIEHRSPKAGVGRSNRPGGTIDFKPAALRCRFSLLRRVSVGFLGLAYKTVQLW